ncbi:EAL domain-containing protein [Desulfovibrio inopinatus]|uniref:EAL domain-containing protein n=1 Tax=Desulfovibrio inopinatus TaxID=102109 RepID=UPI0003F8D78D|nr:EAL domain-containing protein [Desulfovibrio inopinatus]
MMKLQDELLPQEDELCWFLTKYMSEGVGILNAEGLFAYASDRLCQLFGQPCTQLLGTSPAQYFPQIPYNVAVEQFSCQLSGKSLCFETSLTHDGVELFLLISATPFSDSDNRYKGAVLIVTDLTSMRQAEDAALNMERHSRALVDAFADVAILVDKSLIIQAANPKAARENEVSVLGKTLETLFSGDFLDAWTETIRTVFTEGKIRTFQFPYGDRITANRVAPILEKEGVIEKVALFSRDITEQKRNEDGLRSRAFQQGIVAEIGLHALSSSNLDELTEKTCRLLTTVLQADIARVLEYRPDEQLFFFKAGVGWKNGLVGQSTITAGMESLPGFTLMTKEPVVIRDLPHDNRFRDVTFLHDHNVVSGLSVVIHGKKRPYGVLGVFSKTFREFTQDDVHFLQSVANMLSQAMARAETEEALEASNQSNTLILEAVGEGICGIDTTGRTTFINPAAEYSLGYLAEELIGKDHHDAINHSLPDGAPYPRSDSPILKVLNDGQKRYVAEAWFWRKDGRIFPVEYVCTPLLSGDRIIGAAVVFKDITERKKNEERLRYQAYHDELTGLPNRSYFLERLEIALAASKEQKKRGFAVMFLDLDDFKFVNDSLGHTLGDRLLRGISLRLWNCLEGDDVIARLGGDEYAILLTDVFEKAHALAVANHIHDELKVPTKIDGYEIFITACIGIVDTVSHYNSAEEILRDADTAMFQAKITGKGVNCIFDQTMHVRAKMRLQLETDLRRAIERKEFFLLYQPIFSIPEGNSIGFEALIRWNHPEQGIVSPLDFIPVAESTGMILAIGEWVIQEACSQMRKWLDTTPDIDFFTVSCNLSGKQFMQEDLAGRIESIMAEYRIDSSRLKLEITESVIMENAEFATATLKKLQTLGLSLLIDDFGTGYSSLAYLRRLPVDALKVDRMFVRNIDTETENQEIVRTVIQLANVLKLDVVAEGIENDAERTLLESLGCRLGQGYFHAKPLPPSEATAFLPRRSS